MKLSHILIKVDNLDKAVTEWQNKGFVVEYGKHSNPYNALIYFKDGPFIELFTIKPFPKIVNGLLKILGKGKLAEKMNYWANHEEGLLSVMLENYEDTLDNEIAILKENKMGGTLSKKCRTDTKNRKLKFSVLFTNDKYFPDLMTFFSVNPKPKENIHTNNIVGVKSITLGLNEKQIEIFKKICDDERIIIEQGSETKDLVWLYAE